MTQLVRSISELRELLAAARADGLTIGLVPTMGALHEGHLSLVRQSLEATDRTVVSIFVNPTQFGPDEDLDAYPRALDADMEALSECGADFAFVPSAEEVYTADSQTWVTVEGVAATLEGEYRPTHFRGVATIVLKLFNIVSSDVAFFGQKDYQQALVIRRMVHDLNVPVTIRVCPIVREPDGLAMSSRNVYLSPDERQQALVLSKSLAQAESLIRGGETAVKAIEEAMLRLIRTAPDADVDYIAICDPETLAPVETVAGPVVALLAVRVGSTRLIDNAVIEP